MNATIKRWIDEGLVWLPERGVGWLNVTASPYDADYFDKYRAYADTEMGRTITKARVDLTLRYQATGTLVDVGIGCGAFVEARSAWATTKGFDINPAGRLWLKDRRAWCDPREQAVDALSFWDVLEHVEHPESMLANARRYVFVAVPIVPGHGPPALDWKHLRRDEHCLYWTRDGLIGWMRECGFECVEHGTPESLLGREDIHTFVFCRR